MRNQAQETELIRLRTEFKALTGESLLSGVENAGGPGDRPRGLFFDGVVLGYDAIMEHARTAVAEARARKAQGD